MRRKFKLTLIAALLSGSVLNSAAQDNLVLAPSNRSTTSLEKNLLFNATSFYTVTQSGSINLGLDGFFDGNFQPQYSGALNEADPYVVVIEGLPTVHTQAGAWIGWTTRFWQPVKFKIEVYNVYDYGIPGYPAPNTWVTVAEESDYNKYQYIVPVNSVAAAKIRFTFYKGAGPSNAIGISELFFIHPEASRAYDNLMVQYSSNGFVGIGTATPKEKLSVNGKIRAKEIKVETANWPDYVFAEGYKVGTLEELESYIKANKHLPDMPSAKEVETKGVELGEMNKLLLKKVEELTLYLIEQNKRIENYQATQEKQQKEIEQLKALLNKKQ